LICDFVPSKNERHYGKQINHNDIVRRIIQLKAEDLSKLRISQALHNHRATLDNYFSRLTARGKSSSELSEYRDEQLQTFVYSESTTAKADERIDELKKHLDYFWHELPRTGVTRSLIWVEYHQAYRSPGMGHGQQNQHIH
jgi:hypothetical protein